jgi:hypothetical protein
MLLLRNLLRKAMWELYLSLGKAYLGLMSLSSFELSVMIGEMLWLIVSMTVEACSERIFSKVTSYKVWRSRLKMLLKL